MTDKKLLKEIKKGNIQYYEILIDTYSNYVSVIVQKVGRTLSTQDTEELIADVFIKIWTSRNELKIKEGALKSYIGTMARNVTLDKLRSKGRFNEVAFEESEIIYEIFNETPEQQLIEVEGMTNIVKLIETLPTLDKDIFIRRYFYFESLQEISQNMGISIGTIGTKIFRSKKKLQTKLEERGDLLWKN